MTARLELGSRHIGFIGREGAGKTVMAKRLAAETGKVYIGTGAMLKRVAETDSGRLGEACRKMFADNVYIEGRMFLEILSNDLQSYNFADIARGGVFDSGLRTSEESRHFREMLEALGLDLRFDVMNLRIPRFLSYWRLWYAPHARRRGEDDKPVGIGRRLKEFESGYKERLGIIQKEPGWFVHDIAAWLPKGMVYSQIRQSLLVPRS